MDKRQLIQAVYGESAADTILLEIEKVQEKYRSKIKTKNKELTQGDVLVISYGDQIKNGEESKLSFLQSFLKKWAGEHISLVHLLPFYPYSSDDGFSVVDYYEVNPKLGSWDDIESFSSDFELMFDAVINHISQESDWLKRFLENDPLFKDYFTEADQAKDYSQVTRPRTLPLIHEFIDTNGELRHLWTTFSKDQVDINYANPKVLIHILDLLLFYIQKGARAIRLDAIGFMWKELGTNCIHLPQTHHLIQLMRLAIEELAPATLLITETNVPHKENISYFGNGHNEAHLVYNFTLPPLLAYSILSGKTQKLIAWAKSLSLPSEKVCFFNFLASHDGVGVRPVDGILSVDEIGILTHAVVANGGRVSFKTNSDGSESPYELNTNYLSLMHGEEKDENSAIKRMILAHGIMLAMPGLPSIYFHSLFGSLNDIDGMIESGINRRINRQKLRMEEIELELKKEGSVRNQIYHQLIGLIAIRKKHAAFNPYHSFSFPEINDGAFVIERGKEDNKVVCLFNLTSQTMNFQNYTGHHDLISNTIFEGSLNAYGMVWLEK
ncbi:MAG: sugar phosphorylase [Cyclobacteriaceae bacterium]